MFGGRGAWIVVVGEVLGLGVGWKHWCGGAEEACSGMCGGLCGRVGDGGSRDGGLFEGGCCTAVSPIARMENERLNAGRGARMPGGREGSFAAWLVVGWESEWASMPYFDHNATTPLSPAARDAWLKASAEFWQNPASPYREAARVKIRLDGARAKLAEFLGCVPEELVFTSGATEAANAILAHWARVLPVGARIAVNPTEHPSVLEPAGEFFGDRIVWLGLTRDGAVRTEALKTLLEKREVAAVVVMAANNETGALQPWAEIAGLCRATGAEYLCDASQWLGKLPAAGLGGAGWIFGSAHKFGGPKGVGFLRRPAGAEGFRAQLGGAQQRGHRGGTEDFPGASALVAALAEAEQKKVFLETERVGWRERFERRVLAAVPGATVIAGGAERLWNTVSLLLPHTENTRWVARLDKLGFQVSTGSACATGKQGPSHVLGALGHGVAEARRVVRISAGWETAEADWNGLAGALATLDAEFRADKGNVISP